MTSTSREGLTGNPEALSPTPGHGDGPGVLTPATLWTQVDLETRLLAARAVYGSEWDDAASRAEANEAIA